MTVTVIRRVGGNYWEGRQDISGEETKVIRRGTRVTRRRKKVIRRGNRRYHGKGQKLSEEETGGTMRRDKSYQKKK